MTEADGTSVETTDAGAVALPTKVCPSCSVATPTTGPFCPQCGASYDRARKRPIGRRTVLAGLLVLLLLAGGAAGLLLKQRHDDQVRADKAAAVAAREKKEAADAEAAAAAAKTAADDAERLSRAELVTELEASVTKDANARIGKGDLTGPRVTETVCTPLGGGSTDDLTALTGEYQCTAVNKNNADGTREGYRFSGTINYNTKEWSWHLGS